MTTSTTRRAWTPACVVVIALIAFATARAAPPEMFTASAAQDPRYGDGLEVPAALRLAQPRFLAARGFYQTHLAPRMPADAHSDDEAFGARLGDPASRRWTSDPAVVERVEKRTIRSIAAAFKGYVVEQVGIDHWTLPVTGRDGHTSLTGESRAVRFHFGFSRLAPRADLLIPVTAGRVALGVDARGAMRATFDASSSRLRVAADVDAPARVATVRLSVQF